VKAAREKASLNNLDFQHIRGDMRLIHDLVEGRWGEKDFLVVPPGWVVVAKLDENIIRAEAPAQ